MAGHRRHGVHRSVDEGLRSRDSDRTASGSQSLAAPTRTADAANDQHSRANRRCRCVLTVASPMPRANRAEQAPAYVCRDHNGNEGAADRLTNAQKRIAVPRVRTAIPRCRTETRTSALPQEENEEDKSAVRPQLSLVGSRALFCARGWLAASVRIVKVRPGTAAREIA